jgi:hypothetical protein
MEGEGDKRDKAQVGRREQGSGEMGGIKEERKKT